jgi:hypothetical protein
MIILPRPVVYTPTGDMLSILPAIGTVNTSMAAMSPPKAGDAGFATVRWNRGPRSVTYVTFIGSTTIWMPRR